MYRTTSLHGLFARSKGGFYHNGRFPKLMDVVEQYDGFMKLNLSDEQKADLVEYLKSLQREARTVGRNRSCRVGRGRKKAIGGHARYATSSSSHRSRGRAAAEGDEPAPAAGAASTCCPNRAARMLKSARFTRPS
jgi:hypothetical protein